MTAISTRPREGDLISGKYRLLRLIGDGGMGSVFEARHEYLGTAVALKFLHPELARKQGLVARFLQEARLSASIKSPHIVHVTDVDQAPDGAAYLVMELLEGESLQHVLSHKQRLPLETALDYAVQILTGLEAAHAVGVVHRDLKPDNVFVVRTLHGPLIKLLDFGIAKLRAARELKEGLTRPGVVMGTPEYMAPEQAISSDGVDARADVYAAGTILYEMLSGRRPADGDDVQEIAAFVLARKVRLLSELSPGLPDLLVQIVHRAMAPLPDERFRTAADLRDALLPFCGVLSPAGRLAVTAPPAPVLLADDTRPTTVSPSPAMLGSASLASDAGLAPTLPPDDPPPSVAVIGATGSPVPPGPPNPPGPPTSPGPPEPPAPPGPPSPPLAAPSTAEPPPPAAAPPVQPSPHPGPFPVPAPALPPAAPSSASGPQGPQPAVALPARFQATAPMDPRFAPALAAAARPAPSQAIATTNTPPTANAPPTRTPRGPRGAVLGLVVAAISVGVTLVAVGIMALWPTSTDDAGTARKDRAAVPGRESNRTGQVMPASPGDPAGRPATATPAATVLATTPAAIVPAPIQPPPHSPGAANSHEHPSSNAHGTKTSAPHDAGAPAPPSASAPVPPFGLPLPAGFPSALPPLPAVIPSALPFPIPSSLPGFPFPPPLSPSPAPPSTGGSAGAPFGAPSPAPAGSVSH